MNGNGMCDVMCIDDEIRLLHIRGKFKGRGKRDNIIDKSSWLLVGIRDYETVVKGKKQNCDILEVYNKTEKDKLRSTINTVNWNKFVTKENMNNNIEEEAGGEGEIRFTDEQEQEYIDLVEKLQKNKDTTLIVPNNEEEIKVEDL
jgi:hypothetical protein